MKNNLEREHKRCDKVGMYVAQFSMSKGMIISVSGTHVCEICYCLWSVFLTRLITILC